MKKMKIMKSILFTMFIIFVLLNFYKIYEIINTKTTSDYTAIKTEQSTESTETVDNTSKETDSDEEIISNVIDSVVGISKLSSVGGSILNNISSDELGLGTGIIMSSDGYILSNNHVTGGKYSTCYVTINENKYKGTVVWSDEDLDLSILKISANNLKYIELGNSSTLKIGEKVYAIGNPIGYEFRQTVTSGIISALNRTVKIEEEEKTSYMSDLIQTDATINPGNSGGPLINEKGQVIGINTVKITSAEGIGFAVPIDVIKPVVESYIEDGKYEEPSLGLYVIDADVAEYMNLKEKIISGIYVDKVIKNGASDIAGIEEGDILKSIDGNILTTVNDLKQYIYSKLPEDTVTIKLVREEKETEIDVKLEKK